MVGRVGDRHLEVAVLLVRFDPLQAVVRRVVHPLGFLLGDADEEVARLLRVAGVSDLRRHVLQRLVVCVALLAGQFELLLVHLVARPLLVRHGVFPSARESDECRGRGRRSATNL
ncbi:hypothetical protein [Halomicrococcus sp. NG-SE-24]|uniref:hypothetical protein n=1 Tax=Halomicrococcus sp. NG-SE-24 TaxID=3436928 RepID=UPI003D96A652